MGRDHIIDKPGLTFFQVATYARRHKRKHGLDVLVVDYLQLMSGADDEKRHAQIEEITRNLKTLAKELDIAILLLSQLSRKTEESRRPKLSHLRDSGSIEQDADVVLFIHREEVDNPDTQWKNYADIYVAKTGRARLGGSAQPISGTKSGLKVLPELFQAGMKSRIRSRAGLSDIFTHKREAMTIENITEHAAWPTPYSSEYKPLRKCEFRAKDGLLYMLDGGKESNLIASFRRAGVSSEREKEITEFAAHCMNIFNSAPIAIMDTRDILGICAPDEDAFPALYALQGHRVRLVLDEGHLRNYEERK